MADIPILSSIFGTKPEIAPYTNLNLTDEQMKALMGDLEAFPEISRLGDQFQRDYLAELNYAIPGFSDILAAGGALTQQEEGVAKTELAGQVPSDVMAQVLRDSAFTALGSGTLGGPMGTALGARNLGLTSLDLINQGANMVTQAGNAAQRWASLSGAGGAGAVMQSMLQTPQQRAQFDMQQNLIQQAIQQARNNVAAAPDPIAKGLSDIVENLTAAYLGGKVGQIGAGNQSATDATATAFGPQMEQAFAGYDAYGNPLPTQGVSSAGGAAGATGAQGSALPMGPNTSAYSGDLFSSSSYLNTSPVYNAANPPFGLNAPPGGTYNPFGFGGETPGAYNPQYANVNPYLINPFNQGF